MASPTLQIDQGDDEVIHMELKSPLKADAPDQDAWRSDDRSTWGPLDLTGAKLWLTMKTNSGVEVLVKTSDPGEGITVTDAAAGTADVEIAATETASLSDALVGKTLRMDVQVRSATGKITTLRRGTITILRDRQTAT